MDGFYKELEDCSGCLSNKKTLDDSVKRRHPAESDEDLMILHFGNDFSVDTWGKIAPSKAFRRLGFKTQVLTAALNAYIRNRLYHTFDVANIATTIARILGLNEYLCQAIALGHDIGHVPFGHVGENFISEITGQEFCHQVFGVVVAQHIERRGNGLNLTHHVLQGILSHSRGTNRISRDKNIFEEANAVMCADKLAYIWSDTKDIFERARILDYDAFPQIRKLVNECGKNQRERIIFCLKGLCQESTKKGGVSFEDCEAAEIFSEIKDNMYKIYGLVNIQNGAEILETVHSFLLETPIIEGVDPTLVLALMTDTDVLSLYEKKCINAEDFYKCSVAEIIEGLRGKKINFFDPDLNW